VFSRLAAKPDNVAFGSLWFEESMVDERRNRLGTCQILFRSHSPLCDKDNTQEALGEVASLSRKMLKRSKGA